MRKVLAFFYAGGRSKASPAKCYELEMARIIKKHILNSPSGLLQIWMPDNRRFTVSLNNNLAM